MLVRDSYLASTFHPLALYALVLGWFNLLVHVMPEVLAAGVSCAALVYYCLQIRDHPRVKHWLAVHARRKRLRDARKRRIREFLGK
jgi:hypothetical protein